MYKVALLPGHGGFDPGAVNSTNGTRESDGNLGVALKLKQLLEVNGIDVVMSRTADIACGGAVNISQDVANQIAFANNSGADLAVAIHFNSAADKGANGTEVLYSTEWYVDPKRKQLARLLLDELVAHTGLRNRGLKTPSNVSVIK
ncbi:MAG: N-acetylmuramoyl-L-alanine amidase family protein [Syntrophomonadaceae bacterium]|jgi:N-acetylmuramoyl-L-alanine amidase